MDRSGNYSPPLALAKKVLLFGALPTALIVAVLYYLSPLPRNDPRDPFTPVARIERDNTERRVMQDYEQKRKNAYGTADDIVRRAQTGVQ